MLVVTVCTLLFLTLTALHLCHFVSWQRALSVLGLSYVGVTQRLWLFQFFTAPLLHADLTHLAFNMLTLWMLGPSVEAILGQRRYVVFSIICAGCSMAGFLLCNVNTRAIGFGYSGVVFGLLVAQARFFPHKVIYVYAFFPLKMKYAALLLSAIELYLVISPSRNGIGHSAHLFGAIGAFVYLQGTQWWEAHHRQAQHERKSFGVNRRGHTNQHCAQCGIRLPSPHGPLCTRCAAQQTRPPIRPRIRDNIGLTSTQPTWLVVLTGPLAGKRFALATASLTIGRASDNHVVVPDDKKVSRLHAEIVPDGRGCYVIVDKNSRNGLFVNGKRAQRHILRPGDRIRVGTMEMVLADDPKMR